MANGDTKTEAMLNVLGNGGTGDEFRGCCNTKTQSYILDAIDRINSLAPGGSSDFNDLENRPQLNGVAMTGSTDITDFVGTDGTSAGEQGLVPAPTAADADKFLKSDGTWDTAGGGSSVNVVQTTGTSTTDVMSQDATTKTIWKDIAASQKVISIGSTPSASPTYYQYAFGSIDIGGQYMRAGESIAIGIGTDVKTGSSGSVVIGYNAKSGNNLNMSGSIALGYGSGENIIASGMMDVSTTNTSYGYDNTNYRLITGVHDGVNAHDAVTVGQLNALITAINSALGTSIPSL